MTATTFVPHRRTAPALGGFNPTLLRIELRRMLRNRRTIVISLLVPAALFLSFSAGSEGTEPVGRGNVAAYILVSMGLYAAALVAAASGAAVALERSLGWSRQLRVTPLHPVAYIATKALVALLLGAVAITAVNLAGLLQGRPRMPVGIWLACAGVTLLCTLVFAALGLFVGYLVPGDNAMQFLGPGLALFAFIGNVFIPLDPGTTMYAISEWTPMFGVAEIARWPLTGGLPWAAVPNAVGWLALFVAGAAWRMAKDTARV